jgi:hypothetical protein
MWKALAKKIFKMFKTPEGVATIGGATGLGMVGKVMGLVGPSVYAFLGLSITGMNAWIPFAAVGGLLGFLGVRSIKYWILRRKIERMKKKFGWFYLLIKYYNFGFVTHFLIIFMAFVMIVGWGTICSNIGLSDSILELIIIWPLFIIILADIICLVGKFLQRIFSRK